MTHDYKAALKYVQQVLLSLENACTENIPENSSRRRFVDKKIENKKEIFETIEFYLNRAEVADKLAEALERISRIEHLMDVDIKESGMFYSSELSRAKAWAREALSGWEKYVKEVFLVVASVTLIFSLFILADSISESTEKINECNTKYYKAYDTCLLSSDASRRGCDAVGMRAQQVCFAEHRNREKVR